jgi:ParB/RepB/Spo0J family partition protein
MSPAKSEAVLAFVPCSDIRRFQGQPRQFFSRKALQSLKNGIQKDGQKRYAEIKALPEGESHKYELIDGERRWIVCGELQRSLWCLVRYDIADINAQYLQSFLANGGQETLTEYETIKALAKIKEDYGLTNNEGVAELIGRKRDWVRERLAIAKFGSEFLELMSPDLSDEKRIQFTHAQLIARVPRAGRAKLVEIVLREKLSSSDLREMVRKNSNVVSKGGHEYIKCMSLAKRIRDDSEALKDKSRGFGATLRDRSSEDVRRFIERVDCAMGNLATLRKALGESLVAKGKKIA